MNLKISLCFLTTLLSAVLIFLTLFEGGAHAAKDPTLNAALNAAAVSGKLEEVKSLIAKGADVNSKLSSSGGRRGAPPAPVSVLVSALNGDHFYMVNKNAVEMVTLVLNAGADPNGKAAEPLNSLITSSDSPNKIKLINLLIAKGADVNKRGERGNTPLMNAAATNRLDLVQLLVDKGADVNIKNDVGQTALFFAKNMEEYTKNPAIINYLIEKGAK